MVTKQHLIEEVAQKTGLSHAKTKEVIGTLLDTIQGHVANNQQVQITGFGTFEQRSRAERSGRNPQTGASIVIPAQVVPAFRAGKAFKDLVNK